MANLDKPSTTSDASVGGNLSVTGTSALTGAVTTTGALTVGTTLTINGIGNNIFVYKSADENVTSSTTLQADDHLTTTLTANFRYAFEILLVFTSASATPGIKFGFNTPGTDVMIWGADQNDYVNSAGVYTWTFNAAQTVGVGLRGIITVGAATGTFAVTWAQNVSNGTATTMKTGSYMNLVRVA